MNKPQTLKGFRDFLPQEARKRQYVINTFKSVFESYGFEPLETPALEYAEILIGKYGAEGDKLMYRFEDNGGRKVAMRYDQTVPLARVIAQYQNELPLPFKRYQIQPVWRAENTQKGRFREFTQCDIDTVGIDSSLADAQILATVFAALTRLGLKNLKILINDRENLKFSDDSGEFPPDKNLKVVRSLDKLKKIGRDGVINDLQNNGFSPTETKAILENADKIQPTKRIEEVLEYLETFGIDRKYFEFSGTLARGLDYYTGIIFETEILEYTAGAVCSGGRYNNLIGTFAGRQIPAVGCAFGFDRIIEALEEQDLLPEYLSKPKVLVTIFDPSFTKTSIQLTSNLQRNNIRAELWVDPEAKMEKQIKYADQKSIPYVLIIGPEEKEKNVVTLRDMKTREQETCGLDEIIDKLR